jgi:hypothetical protein
VAWLLGLTSSSFCALIWVNQVLCEQMIAFLWACHALHTDPLFNRYVRHTLQPIQLFQSTLTNPPFLDFTVLLESTTFARTLILLKKYFLVMAWSCENNSTYKMTMWSTCKFSPVLNMQAFKRLYAKQALLFVVIL